jgi:hypothetical protein
LQAGWEVLADLARRPALASQRVLGLAIIASGGVFAAIKLAPLAGDAYRAGLGWLQWLPSAALASVTGGDPGVAHRVMLAADPTDLVALVALAVPWLIGRRRDRQVAE